MTPRHGTLNVALTRTWWSMLESWNMNMNMERHEHENTWPCWNIWTYWTWITWTWKHMHMLEDMNMMEGLHEHRHAWSHILLKKQIRNKTIKTEAQTVFSIALSPGGETKKQDKKGKTCTCWVLPSTFGVHFAESLQCEFSAPLCQHASTNLRPSRSLLQQGFSNAHSCPPSGPKDAT